MTTELLRLDAAEEAAVPSPLTADVHHVGALLVLRLEGVLHAGSLAVVQRQFDRLGRTPCRRVVLDLAGLTAIDAAGARLLTGLYHYVAGRGGHLAVVGAGPAICQALAATALAGA